MKRRPLKFWHDGWKKIMTTCMRCGGKNTDEIILKGDKKCYYSMCSDCSFSLNYNGHQSMKGDMKKILMKRIMDDIFHKEWNIQVKKKKTMAEILEILDFSKADMEKLFPEIIGESL